MIGRLSLVFILLLMGEFSSCIPRVASFYRRPSRASYYTNRYCFEVPKERVIGVVSWLLQRYHFPVKKLSLGEGVFETAPFYLDRYSRDPNKGYVISLRIRVRQYTGKLSFRGFPSWALERGKRKLPPPPERGDYRDRIEYERAYSSYIRRLEREMAVLERITALMKKWQGCDIRTSTLRTVVEIESSVIEYPLGRYGQLLKERGRRVKSDLSLEYSILRVIGWRLGKLSHMPPLLY